MSRALVTGGLGFIGQHLAARLLAEGFDVHVVDNAQRGSVDAAVETLRAHPRYCLTIGDVADPAALAALGDGCTHVFHLAAVVGVRNVVEQPYRVLAGSVAALSALLDWACAQPSLRRFVFSSTSEVYAGTLAAFGIAIPTPESTPLAIADPGRPRTAYMLSKIYGEALCRSADVPFTIVRPHNVYGPRMGMAHVMPELLARAWRAPPGGELTVYSPDHRRTFCYVDDAVELMLRLALAPAALGGTFNVGRTADEVSMMGLAGLVAETVGRPLRPIPGPDTAGSPVRRQPDIGLAVAATGYTPQVALRDGLERTFRWYRDNVFEAQAAAAAAAMAPGGPEMAGSASLLS